MHRFSLLVVFQEYDYWKPDPSLCNLTNPSAVLTRRVSLHLQTRKYQGYLQRYPNCGLEKRDGCNRPKIRSSLYSATINKPRRGLVLVSLPQKRRNAWKRNHQPSTPLNVSYHQIPQIKLIGVVEFLHFPLQRPGRPSNPDPFPLLSRISELSHNTLNPDCRMRCA